MNKPKILIVEDDKELQEVLTLLLQNMYTIKRAEDGVQGLKAALREPPDLILLDLKMPHMDGFQTCKLIRADAEFKETPIIVVSGFGGVDDRTRALEAGADDFIAKPFDSGELKARIKRRIEVFESGQNNRIQNGILKVGRLRLESATGKAFLDEHPVHFSQLEFRILQMLLEAHGNVVSREAILEKVWAHQAASARVIDPHIVSIRNKLAGSTLVITSFYKKGYSLSAAEG